MISNLLAQAMLAAAKDELDGGNFYIFSGSVPADADDALDMVTDHTLCVKMTESNDGSTGLTFGSPTGTSLPKNGSEVWLGLVNFVGFEGAESELTPTFFRFCTAGDNGQGAAAAPRLQGTIGGPSSGAQVLLGSDTLTDNGSNTQGIGIFNVPLSAIG